MTLSHFSFSLFLSPSLSSLASQFSLRHRQFEIAKETAKDWVKLTVQNRQAKVSVVPSTASLGSSFCLEPDRDRKMSTASEIEEDSVFFSPP
ncbi:putative ribosomal protein L11 [Rosa chinensis]|uniref:Putative ribosomal protein L11 n=1 Tax=Rosa chinensis TaxID=74649 RepID=A0A2P6QUP3_ROSCH|nr:putative ribosomal protein L11 [Rosa chinensis]